MACEVSMSKEYGKLQHVFIDEDEWKRYQEVIRRAYKRAATRNELDKVKNDKPVIRRLLGLERPDWIVTKDDIKYFQGSGEAKSAGENVLRGSAQGSAKKAGNKRHANGE